MNHSQFSRNIPLFIAFRVLFNARWYYPVLAVLFLDLGLSIEQYALLNVVWAAAIVGLEVPSGALADYLGRKKMVVLAALLMVAEMIVFAFAPRGNPSLLFGLFVVNRVLSGAAEASASGADEALAYDSLVSDGRAKEWPNVLEKLMRWQSVAFFAAMMLGAALYDATFVQKVISWLGLSWNVTQEMTTRFPLYLTLGNAVLALLVTFAMKEPTAVASNEGENGITTSPPFSATLATGKWILATPIALGVIMTGLCFDSISRVFLTFASNYYRIISIPAATFGLIGSGFALFGFFVPMLARKLIVRWSMRGNFIFVATLIFIGFIGLAQVWPIYGLIWLIPLGIAMNLTQFYVSHYLNELVTDSSKRATVLSFKGLAFNLGYGGAGLLFAGLTTFLKSTTKGGSSDSVFVAALGWLPWYFLATVMFLAIASYRKNRS